MFAMHGAIYLMLKTEGDILERARRWLPRLMGAFVALNTLVVIASLAPRPALHTALSG